MRIGVALFCVLAVAATATAAGAPPTRRAVAADDAVRGRDAFHVLHEWWTIWATNPATGDYLMVRLYDRPTPSADFEVREHGVARGEHAPALTLEPHSGPGVTLASVPDVGPRLDISIARAGSTWVLDSAYGNAKAHVVTAPTAPGVTAGPWRLPAASVGGPPATLVPGTFNWSVLVPAGRATGSVEIDGTRTQLNGWTAYHDHVWGAFDRNWFHGDFGLRATATGDSWALEGLEPADGPSTYRWRASDARFRGVLLHVSRGHTTACAPRVARAGWIQVHPLAEKYTYFAPTTLRATCGGTTLTLTGARPGSDTFDGLVRVGGPTSTGGWFVHTTPQFG